MAIEVPEPPQFLRKWRRHHNLTLSDVVATLSKNIDTGFGKVPEQLFLPRPAPVNFTEASQAEMRERPVAAPQMPSSQSVPAMMAARMSREQRALWVEIGEIILRR